MKVKVKERLNICIYDVSHNGRSYRIREVVGKDSVDYEIENSED